MKTNENMSLELSQERLVKKTLKIAKIWSHKVQNIRKLWNESFILFSETLYLVNVVKLYVCKGQWRPALKIAFANATEHHSRAWRSPTWPITNATIVLRIRRSKNLTRNSKTFVNVASRLAFTMKDEFLLRVCEEGWTLHQISAKILIFASWNIWMGPLRDSSETQRK